MTLSQEGTSRGDQMDPDSQHELTDAMSDLDQEIGGADISILRPEDLELGGNSFRGLWTHCVSIRAAGRQNADVLRAVINYSRLPKDMRASYHAGPDRGGYLIKNCALNNITDGVQMSEWGSTLLAAVLSQSVANVDLLLRAGVDVNDMPIRALETYLSLFRRFRIHDWRAHNPLRVWEHVSASIKTSQTAPLTTEEIADRAHGLTRFWTEKNVTPLDAISNGDSMPCIVAAARTGNIDILKRLLQSKPDISSWLTSQNALPEPLTPSSLAVRTPLQAAVTNNQVGMVQYLLSIGFDVNSMAIGAPTRCYTPLMAAIIAYPISQDVLPVLLSSTKIDLDLRTPVYQVHTLHFAVAKHSLALLNLLSEWTNFNTAGFTAIGHSLLHVACLPSNEHCIRTGSPEVAASIHEIRALEPPSNPPPLANLNDRSEQGMRDRRERRVMAPRIQADIDTPHTLKAIIEFLQVHCQVDPCAVDIHGNTALHYLASHMTINVEAIHLVRSMHGGETAWSGLPNSSGFTAEGLFRANEVSAGLT